jgi:hypothetical protein
VTTSSGVFLVSMWSSIPQTAPEEVVASDSEGAVIVQCVRDDHIHYKLGFNMHTIDRGSNGHLKKKRGD